MCLDLSLQDLFIKVLQKPLSLKTWEGVKLKLTSPETGLTTYALMLRQARKYRGVTVSKAVTLLFFRAQFLFVFTLLYSLVFKNVHAGTRVI